MTNKPNISKRSFWDVDFDRIDWGKCKQYLIVKVMNHGSFEDVLGLFAFYGHDVIKSELISAENLPVRIMYFAMTYFNLDKEDFACYNTNRSYQSLR